MSAPIRPLHLEHQGRLRLVMLVRATSPEPRACAIASHQATDGWLLMDGVAQVFVCLSWVPDPAGARTVFARCAVQHREAAALFAGIAKLDEVLVAEAVPFTDGQPALPLEDGDAAIDAGARHRPTTSASH